MRRAVQGEGRIAGRRSLQRIMRGLQRPSAPRKDRERDRPRTPDVDRPGPSESDASLRPRCRRYPSANRPRRIRTPRAPCLPSRRHSERSVPPACAIRRHRTERRNRPTRPSPAGPTLSAMALAGSPTARSRRCRPELLGPIIGGKGITEVEQYRRLHVVLRSPLETNVSGKLACCQLNSRPRKDRPRPPKHRPDQGLSANLVRRTALLRCG